jgi:hypothetical protein
MGARFAMAMRHAASADPTAASIGMLSRRALMPTDQNCASPASKALQRDSRARRSAAKSNAAIAAIRAKIVANLSQGAANRPHNRRAALSLD